MNNNNQIEPKDYHLLPVGTGGFTSCWTDRQPVTLVRVINERTVEVREANWKVISGSEYDGSAKYEYSDNPDGITEIYTKRAPTKRARFWKWVRKGETSKNGTHLGLGAYSRYFDPSF